MSLSIAVFKQFMLLFLIQVSVFAQTPEQVALDFYGENILTKERKSSVRFDAYVKSTDSLPQNFGTKIVDDYFFYKIMGRELSRKEKVSVLQTWKEKQLDSSKVGFSNAEHKKLTLPKNIKKRKKLRYKKLKGGGLNFYADKVRYFFFGVKYNLEVCPAVEFENHYYVLFNLNKNDFETGKEYIFKIDKSLEIVDFAHTSWIQ